MRTKGMFVALLALAFVTVACSNTVAVSGVVLDMRTSAPVPGAVVVAGSIKGTSNAKGRFHLASVPKDAKIEVSAANYRTKTVAASANVLTIKIAPIPVTGTALSAFTGKGIPATITGKGLNEKASSDGTFSVYGVGPGDTLTVSAIGHVTATVTIGDNRVANVSLKLGRIDPEALIPVISGYGFENVPKALKDEALRGIRSDPDIGKYITGFAGKSVTSGGEGVAVVVVVAVSPSVAALPGIREAYFSRSISTASSCSVPQEGAASPLRGSDTRGSSRSSDPKGPPSRRSPAHCSQPSLSPEARVFSRRRRRFRACGVLAVCLP